MLEIQITTPDLSEALKVLATAIAGRTSVLMQAAATPAAVPTPAPVAAPAAPAAPAAQKPVPTGAPQYTLDMLATAGSALIDAGKMDQLVQLLTKFGVASLTDLQPEHYGAVANELRALGAAI